MSEGNRLKKKPMRIGKVSTAFLNASLAGFSLNCAVWN